MSDVPFDQHRDGHLDQPTQAVPIRPVPIRPDPTRTADLVGDRYRLEKLVGRGGTAEVWAATDIALERRVAVKLVTASGGEDSARVAGEARLLARLNHPGLVPVFDAGTDDAGRPWVVMEFVDGETLAEVVRRGAVPVHDVAAMGRALAEALQHVHEERLVHRDVKPANVLVGRDGRVRLTDFGIARLVDAAKVTATGFTVGTASYLSPEQVTGAAVGPPSDVYSLGLVLIECLTGEREYSGSAVEAAMARLHRQARVPSGLPGGLSALLLAMTALEAERRPTAQKVARDLAAVASGGQATTTTSSITTIGAPPRGAADRTEVLDRTSPRSPVRTASAMPPVPAGRSRGKVALALLGVVVLLVLGAVLLLPRAADPTGPPAKVDPSIPAQLRDDVQKLQDEVVR